jgi:hypothetical protein
MQTLQLYVDDRPGADYHLEAKEDTPTLDFTTQYDRHHSKLRLGTSAFLRLAAGLSSAGYKIRGLGLTDFRLQPLDQEEAAAYQQIFIEKLRQGNARWVEDFLSNKARGVFVVTVEFQSPKRGLVRLERQGLLRIEDTSRDEFLNVLEGRLAGTTR